MDESILSLIRWAAVKTQSITNPHARYLFLVTVMPLMVIFTGIVITLCAIPGVVLATYEYVKLLVKLVKERKNAE